MARGEGLYLEIAFLNKNASRCAPALVAGDGVDHQLFIERWCDDYGIGQVATQLLASNSNGLITAPATGVIAIAVPPDALVAACGSDGCNGWSDYGFDAIRPSSLRLRLLAVPADATRSKTLLTGVLSLGDRAMAAPRLTLGVYPLYPNAPSSFGVSPVQVSQIKMQLAAIGQLDKVEGALGSPTSPATLQWTTGGTVGPNGPLMALVASALGYNTAALASFMNAAGALPA